MIVTPFLWWFFHILARGREYYAKMAGRIYLEEGDDAGNA
jgi:hypothetical protein